jgi:hypothetical protein
LSSRLRTLAALTALGAVLFVALLAFSRYWATPRPAKSDNDATTRSAVASAYPGFRIVELTYHYEPGVGWWPGESSPPRAWYSFRLESKAVPAFHLEGRYYVTPGSAPDRGPSQVLRDNLFNSNRLSPAQLVELEGAWVRDVQGVTVAVGDESNTGEVVDQTKVREAQLQGTVYVINPVSSKLRFFLRDKADHWRDLPDFGKYYWGGG